MVTDADVDDPLLSFVRRVEKRPLSSIMCMTFVCISYGELYRLLVVVDLVEKNVFLFKNIRQSRR
jgi:hypothetical protein